MPTDARQKQRSPGATNPPASASSSSQAQGPVKQAMRGKVDLPPAPPVPERLFRRLDWVSFAVTALITLVGYWWTLAPDVTLEDSGELSVASMYLGVPHAPGYPVWTLYTWLFATFLPVSNIAWRVAFSSAVAGALSCGLVALMVSRGSSMILEGVAELKQLDRQRENALCLVSGVVAGLLIGFNGFMWSQAVIVEVYTLSMLSLTAVLVCVLRWIYAPHQTRYLYFAFFWFGICFNNHQSLLVIALGLEAAVLMVAPRLARELLFWNGLVYLGGLIGLSMGYVSTLQDNPPLLLIYHLIGIASLIGWVMLSVQTKARMLELARNAALVASLGYLAVLFGHITNYVNYFEHRTGTFVLVNLFGLGCIAAFIHLVRQTRNLPRDWLAALGCGGAWGLGSAFYLAMPLFSMANPPMNWCYPRTVFGFFHAMTRGQYEKIHPTTDPLMYIKQIGMYIGGALDEFNVVYLLIGLIPFLFYKRLAKREKAWLVALTAIYLCLSFFLLMLLNPQADRQGRDLNRVFFTASHVLIAMGVGYGLTLVGAWLALYYQKVRRVGLWSSLGAVALALALAAVVWQTGDKPFAYQGTLFDLVPSFSPLDRGIAVLTVGLAAAAAVLFALYKQYLPLRWMFILMCILPLRPVLAHWSKNEQRGHLFGYWFGHDMFTPPFNGADGKPLYPEMTRDAVLFGGTDPGRFNPTYMNFCESFIPPSKKPRDPQFDRRDVYLITQNALADPPYLDYIRGHYNRSAQIDPPFLSVLLRGPSEIAAGVSTNILAAAVAPIDRWVTQLGARIEKWRRGYGLYPLKEIRTPSLAERERATSDYITDAQRRLDHDRRFPNEPHQIRPGEDIRISPNGVAQVSGQTAVMGINAILTKVIFDANPDHEFFVEESFALDWMYPYLTPYGIIMKINRQPPDEITEEMVRVDHEFWTRYSERLIGNWITYDTGVADLAAWCERIYYKGDRREFKGEPKFARDDDAQKAFSKLRSSISGLYFWRMQQAAQKGNAAAYQRMFRESEFAMKQAFAFCPFSPEATYRYVNLLLNAGRMADAVRVLETALKLDPFNAQLRDYMQAIKGQTK